MNDKPFDSAPANFVIYYNKGSVEFPAKFGGLSRYTQREISSSVPPTVIVPSVIASQPVLLQKVVAGQSATFSVTASGLGEVSYQWKRNGAPVSGATGRTFIIVAARLTDA